MRKIAIMGLVAMLLMASMIVMVPQDVKANPTPGLLYHTTAGNDVNQVAVSGDGSTAAAASDDGKIYVIGRAGLKSTFSVTSGETANCVAVSRDGNYVVGGDSAGYLWLLDSSGSKLDSWNGLSESYIYSVDIDRYGNHVIDSDDVGISYFDTSSHDFSTKDWYDLSYAYYKVDMSDDGNRILLFNGADMMVKDGAGNDLWSSKWTEPNNAGINWADMSEDGSMVAVVTDNNRLYLLDASNAAQEWYATLPDTPNTVSISGDGSKIVCDASYTYLFYGTSNTPVYSWDTWSPAVISYDGGYSSGYDYSWFLGTDTIRLTSTDNETVWEYVISDYVPYKRDMAVSDDGSHIIVADASYNIYYISSIPETNISYDKSYSSGSSLYLSDSTSITLTADYIASSVTTYWKVDSESYHTYSGPFALSSYSEGVHTLYYYSEDSYGNTETVKTLDFYLDKNSPSVTITSPIDGSWVNSTFTVEWSGSDEGSGIDHYEVRIDSGPWTDVGTSTSYDFTGISDGQHTIDVRALDMFSHEGSDSVTVNVDGTNPTVSISSPGDGEILSSSDVTVSWSGSDSGSGIDHYEVRIDSGSWVDAGTATSHTFTGLSDGSHTVDVMAIDNAGNNDTDSIGFSIDTSAPPDTTPPSLSITSPADGSEINEDSVTVSWSGEDTESGMNHYEVRVDGGSWTDVGTSTSHDFTGLSDGSHAVDVKAVDNAGNEQTSSVHFTVSTDNGEGGSDMPSGESGSSYIWWVLILLIAVVLALFLVIKKKKEKPEETDEPAMEDEKGL